VTLAFIPITYRNQTRRIAYPKSDQLENDVSKLDRVSTQEQKLTQANSLSWPDLAGHLNHTSDGRSHVLPVRVYFEDTDFSGLVYHASYVRWCERGRSDFLRLLGNDHKSLFDGIGGQEAAAFVVRRMVLDYLRPARIDEILEVTTRVKELKAATLTLNQSIARREPDGTLTQLFAAEVMVVLVSQSGRVLRISKLIRDALSA
jgi:acyl-CoA thioester hydrolase